MKKKISTLLMLAIMLLNVGTTSALAVTDSFESEISIEQVSKDTSIEESTTVSEEKETSTNESEVTKDKKEEEATGESQNANDSPLDTTGVQLLEPTTVALNSEYQEALDFFKDYVKRFDIYDSETAREEGAKIQKYAAVIAANNTQLSRASLAARAGLSIDVPAWTNISSTDTRWTRTDGASIREYGWYGKRFSSEVAWCIQLGVALNLGITDNYTKLLKNDDFLEKASIIALYGYHQQPSLLNELQTQMMIWELQGNKLNSIVSGTPDYQSFKNTVNAKVNMFYKTPSISNKAVTVKSGGSVTITDTTGAFANYKAAAITNTANVNYTKSGNSLTITPKADSNASGVLTFQYDIPSNYQGSPIVLEAPWTQNLMVGRVNDPVRVSIPVNVLKSGSLEIVKIDADTGIALGEAQFEVAYADGKTVNITGNDKGLASINDLPDGTTGTIKEVKAPNGYLLSDQPYSFKIEAGKTTTVTIKNTPARQDIRLIKKDNITGAVLPGVEFDLLKVVGDQLVPVSKHVTDRAGMIVVKGLTVGKYQFVETKALPGYQLLAKPVEFNVTVETHGQLIELIATNNRKPITIVTKAQFNNGAQLYDPLAKVPVKESVILNGLVPGSEYTLAINAFQLSTKEQYEKIVKSHIFKATAEKMTLDFDFELDGKELKGTGIVFTEILSFQDKIVSRHEDLENKTQTVEFTHPEIATLAQFENGSHLYDPLSKVPVKETTQLTGLIPGQEYTLDVQGKRLSTGEAYEGTTDQKVFVADSEAMTFTFEFELDGKDLLGDGIVFTERLFTEDEEIAVHEDLENKEQTVEFTNPQIETLAQFENGSHLYDPLSKVPVKETTILTGLIPGQEYTLDVQGNRLSTGEAYEGITDQNVFVADSEEMTFTFEFELDGKDLIGDGIVFTERLFTQDEEIAEHTDLENEKQTVKFTDPTIQTKASGTDGAQLLPALSQVPVKEETVMTGLIPGATYTLNVQGYRLSTQAPYDKTKVVKTFVADAETMTFTFEFMLDGRELAQDGIVFTETLYTQDEKISEHVDLKNERQTVRFKAIPDVPQLPQTGERVASIGVFLGLVMLLLVVFMSRFKKEKEA